MTTENKEVKTEYVEVKLQVSRRMCEALDSIVSGDRLWDSREEFIMDAVRTFLRSRG